jgi:hypothetical protein
MTSLVAGSDDGAGELEQAEMDVGAVLIAGAEP